MVNPFEVLQYSVMQLTQYTDYSLRVLIYLSTFPDRKVTIATIAKNFNVSQNHLKKVVHNLSQHGLLKSIRGRSGGLRLGKDPAEITVADVIRVTESSFNLAECFNQKKNTCPIYLTCALKRILGEASGQFMSVLDNYTMADIVGSSRGQLKHLDINIVVEAIPDKKTDPK